MSLFLKIFLWFWLVTALLIGVLIFISWSTQREPFLGRVRGNFTNQLNVYSEIAAQVYEEDGYEGIAKFLEKLKASNQIKEACLALQPNENCFKSGSEEHARKIIEKAFKSGNVEFEFLTSEENYAAKRVTTSTGENLVLALQVQFQPAPIPFGLDWRTRAIRLLAFTLTATLLCYALARYLVAPIYQLQTAARKLADGDLSTRIESRRRDELGRLARDFDEMAKRIETLIGSQKRLLRDVSHELRSPLARMNVALELAKQRSNDETKPLLERIETENSRLNEMISQILTISKLETRAEEIETREVNLKKLVEQIASDAEFEAAGRGKSVKILRLDECSLSGSENLLRSAIENVMRNAVRYTKPGTAVEVSLTNGDKNALITIRDHGKGVPENELKEIFQPFYRINEARERKTGGIGLGLAITKQAVKAHNGEIAAKNTGDGLQVEIKFPLNGAHQ
jgi:Signal transduction histidine kinase